MAWPGSVMVCEVQEAQMVLHLLMPKACGPGPNGSYSSTQLDSTQLSSVQANSTGG